MYLTAFIKSKPGQAARLKTLLLELVAASRRDEGCLQYDLHQSDEDPNQFIFLEQWADRIALEKHNQQPHLLRFAAESKYLTDGNIIIYKHSKIA